MRINQRPTTEQGIESEKFWSTQSSSKPSPQGTEIYVEEDGKSQRQWMTPEKCLPDTTRVRDIRTPRD